MDYKVALMQIIEEIHYILKVDGEELRNIKDALTYYQGEELSLTPDTEELDQVRQLLNTIAEMV